MTGLCAVNATTPPAGYSVNNTDCNDSDNAINAIVTTTTTTSACDTYTWSVNSATYTASTTQTVIVNSCDTRVLNLTVNSSSSGTTSTTACDSYTWAAPLGNGTTYTSSQTGITNVSTNAAGCPHTQTLNLTINNSTSSSQSATACDSYTWSVNNVTYTTGGAKIYTSTNAAGCTDTKILVLTINNSTSESASVTACDSYTWSAGPGKVFSYDTSGTYTSTSTNAAGCTHTKTLVLTINSSSSESASQTVCDSYTWTAGTGDTYTASGTYTSTGLNAAGCTHTEILNLTIIPAPAAPTTACYETATFNTTTCSWVVSGSQPAAPTVACYQTATWNGTSCQYDVTGSPEDQTTYYADADGDGFGNALVTILGCTQPEGYVTNNTDCNDAVYSLTNTCSSIVNLKLNIQGYYDADAHAMRAVMANQGVGSSTTDVDDVTVELRDSSTSALVASVTARLHTDGTATATFGTAPSGSFYIAVKHRNAIQTWSATAQTVGSTPLTYDFTTAANKAYGDNMIELESGVYGFYSGDLNQDEAVDIFDFPLLLNDNDNFSSGYLSTDLNGDGAVDIFDFPLLLNNNDNFIYSSHP